MDQTAETAAKPAYKRILLKLSGEALMGEDSFGINRTVLARMVEEIKSVVELGVQVATSSAASHPAPPAWTAPRATTWACSPRS